MFQGYRIPGAMPRDKSEKQHSRGPQDDHNSATGPLFDLAHADSDCL
jgi:hypothetical protein